MEPRQPEWMTPKPSVFKNYVPSFVKMYFPPYMKRMIDHIYVSDYRAMIDYDKFDLVINLDFPKNGVKEGEYLIHKLNDKTTVVAIGLRSDESQDILPFLEKTNEIIKEYVTQHKMILIHSRNGDNRTAAILSGYLMKQYKFNMSDLHHIYTTARYKTSLGQSYVDQLNSLSNRVHDTSK